MAESRVILEFSGRKVAWNLPGALVADMAQQLIQTIGPADEELDA